ncbi:hypothetical protein ABSA28_00395 [Candidatus Hepatincolaceae symbiont of Richtersius coronifer]
MTSAIKQKLIYILQLSTLILTTFGVLSALGLEVLHAATAVIVDGPNVMVISIIRIIQIAGGIALVVLVIYALISGNLIKALLVWLIAAIVVASLIEFIL